MPGQRTCTVTVRVRWWVRWYVNGLILTSHLTGLEPDVVKVRRTLGWLIKHGGIAFEIR